MLKRTIEYEDYEGNKRVNDYYFHLSKSELVKWLLTEGDYTLDKVLERLTKTNNRKETMKIFEDLLHRSYGVKSLDGCQFVKRDEDWMRFYESPAYDILFMELVGSGKKAAEFVNSIIPQDLAEEVLKIAKEHPEGIPDELKDYLVDSDEDKNKLSVVK